MRCREAELFQAAAFPARGLLLEGLQVFTEQVKAGRNAQVHHHHICGFGQVVLDGGGGGSDVILRQAGAVVGDVDRQRFAGRFLVPRYEVAAHYLVGQAALARETEFDGVDACRRGILERELVKQVVVVRRQRECAGGLAVDRDLHGAANVGRAFVCGKQHRAQRHDGGLRIAPSARSALLGGDIGESLAGSDRGLS